MFTKNVVDFFAKKDYVMRYDTCSCFAFILVPFVVLSYLEGGSSSVCDLLLFADHPFKNLVCVLFVLFSVILLFRLLSSSVLHFCWVAFLPLLCYFFFFFVLPGPSLVGVMSPSLSFCLSISPLSFMLLFGLLSCGVLIYRYVTEGVVFDY